MSDGLNTQRAFRIGELMVDVSGALNRTRSFSSAIIPGTENLIGGQILRRILSETEALSGKPIPQPEGTGGSDEDQKKALQSAIVDAASRRFVAHRLMLRGVAAVAWYQRRGAILGGNQPGETHTRAFAENDAKLRHDIAAVSDNRVFAEMRGRDHKSLSWDQDMPQLHKIQEYAHAHLS